ncbi:MAG: GtrA family protein [Sphingomonadaceae bacterium]
MPSPPPADAPLHRRLFTRRVGGMLVRNTVVSTGVFLIGLGVLFVLVEYYGVDEVIASGIGFVISNSIHYLFGRWWVFAGTERQLGKGYALFLLNSGVGLALTMGLMWVFLQFTPINYLIARVLVSVVAGLAMFVLNAVWNFRRV